MGKTVIRDGEEYGVVSMKGITLKEYFTKLSDLPKTKHCVDLREPVVIVIRKNDSSVSRYHCSSIGGGHGEHKGVEISGMKIE